MPSVGSDSSALNLIDVGSTQSSEREAVSARRSAVTPLPSKDNSHL